MKRRAFIEQRTRIFMGCEGESEGAYVSLLRAFAEDARLPIHVHAEVFPKGVGDPLARVERACMRIEQLHAQRGAFRHKFILLDTDQIENDKGRADRAMRLAAEEEIILIWQEPCHEALLLRHLPGRADRRPPATAEAVKALQKEWPEYAKPMTRHGLSQRLDLEAVRRAAQVEDQLARLLHTLGLGGG